MALKPEWIDKYSTPGEYVCDGSTWKWDGKGINGIYETSLT